MKLTQVPAMNCSLCGREHRYKEDFDHCGYLQMVSLRDVDHDEIRERYEDDGRRAAAIAKATGAKSQ
jgi:hypothetical protein